jgi:hypothetical protein
LENNNEQSRILYSCYSNINKEGEHLIREHVLSIILAGSQIVHLGDTVYEFNAGDIRFFRKNQLSKFIKQCPPDGVFKSLTVLMDKETLHQFSINHKQYMDSNYNGDSLLLLRPNELLNKYFESLSLI